MIDEIQKVLNNFVLAGQKARIRTSFLQLRKDWEQGGIALSNMKYYYQAAMLEHMFQWWNPADTCAWDI